MALTTNVQVYHFSTYFEHTLHSHGMAIRGGTPLIAATRVNIHPQLALLNYPLVINNGN